MSTSPTFKPFPFQQKGIDFLTQGGSLLAYDMGLGKTLTSLWAALQVTEAGSRNILLGCPAVAVGVWQAEIERVQPGAAVFVLTSSTLRQYRPGSTDFVIVSLDLVARNQAIRAALQASVFNVCIIDEAHNLKDPAAIRTQAWLTGRDAIGPRAGRLWLLSGTPTPNHAAELWSLVSATAPDRLNGQTYNGFAEMFCKHKMMRLPGSRPGRVNEKRVIAGTNAAMIPALRERLAGWWLRARKEDVLQDLPTKLTRVVPIDARQLSADEDAFMASAEGRQLRMAIEAGSLQMSDPGLDQSMSRLRRLLALAKAEAAARHVADLVDHPDCPGAVLWFWHREAMDLAQDWLEDNGYQVCRIDGSTPLSDRRDIVAAFQSPTGPKIFLGQIKAAGVAITLTKANRAVFAEASWTPSDNAQAVDRIYRIGQTRGIVVEFLAARDSIDMALMDIVERKQREITHLIEGEKA